MTKVTTVITTLFLSLCLCFVSTNVLKANAMELTGDDYDALFVQTLDNVLSDNYDGNIEFVASKEVLYDLNLDFIGYTYEFTIGDENGFATIINVHNSPFLLEIYFNADSPFQNNGEGQRIIITESVYGLFTDGNYYFTSGELINPSLLQDVALYTTAPQFSEYQETVYYTNKNQVASYEMAKRYPALININDETDRYNGCAAISATNVIQFWDRYCTNLIPNYTPGVAKGQYYLYHQPNDIVKNVGIDLYSRMNVSAGGVTISNFKKGFTSYCTDKGYNVTYTTCMTNGKFDYTAAKGHMVNGTPLVLFLLSFDLNAIEEGDGYDTLYHEVGNVTHTMSGFGYKEISYTLTDGSVRNDNYLIVSSGFTKSTLGYLNSSNEGIHEVYAIKIF